MRECTLYLVELLAKSVSDDVKLNLSRILIVIGVVSDMPRLVKMLC